ncbi:MAG: c-type cytochrome [Marinobacter sp.]|uniref:c-type cytochrome n=1 Tax=Marinobacter sp. TaxID=50741 RepID=UPI00299CE816|nr:c-type cytochrome [Marinobacter sp.]MDX1633754.1 c-type cytochrome [Marinobacter sp.]
MRFALTCAAVFAMTAATAHAQDADTEAGKSLYAGKCAQCHGKEGQGMAIFPSLQGRDADYIASRLKTYRAGEKVGANSGVMIANAKGLSDDDIRNLAAYISSNFK